MTYPITRMRRLRNSAVIRSMVSENNIRSEQLILPLFFDANIDSPVESESMPGVYRYPLSGYKEIADDIEGSGVSSVLIFGVPRSKDRRGSDAFDDNGVVQQAIRGLKENSDLFIVADLCMCEYTDHGHCGILKDGDVDNDETLKVYAKIAVSQAKAGADMIAPSGMMDGQVSAIRAALDEAGYDIPIMAYSAKYRSSFYGPFRSVACSAPGHGDRSSYQMPCENRLEALREMKADVEEGADIIMVKPAMSYLDIVRDARESFDVPIAAYQVSGEYSMIMAAAANGWMDHDAIMMESLLSIKRAGADIIITYFAKEASKFIRGSQ